MTTDYRALCAELSFIWGRSTNPDDLFENMIPLVDRARAALAQPEPVEVTDEELLRTYGLAKRDYCYEGPSDDWPKRAERAATIHGLRAVLARYARPTIEPVSQS
jgi:hypothetical protein